ncbi:hypothetical protein ACQPWY_27240 [Pseudonocardia xinjiangensis]|uniref:hypothetical protein n=1 Tax=Pseudonocardia xinjiangensis TaxID=75289 RepID=UPI003D8E29E0
MIRRLAEQQGVHHEALDPPGRGQPHRPAHHRQTEELRRLRKENAELRRANEILKAASAFSPRKWTQRGRSIETVTHLRDQFGVYPILRALGIAPSTYYGWLDRHRRPSDRQ